MVIIKKMNKMLFSFMKGAFAISILFANQVYVQAIENDPNFSTLNVSIEEATRNEDYFKHYNPDEIVRVIVELEKPSAIEKETKKGNKIPSESTIDAVKEGQKEVQKEVEKITGEKTNNSFGTLFNGFSIDAKIEDISDVKKVDGVKNVKLAKTYYPSMSSAKELTQVKQVWENYSLNGSGMVVSIIDSGIDPSHKDMRIEDKSLMKLKKDDIKEGPGKFYTDKVPYGYNFADKNDVILDTNPNVGMHGMHVAGIVAANGIQSETDTNTAIKGVAPEAQLLAMKVFSNKPGEEGAKEDDIVAAIEESVIQGADVINMSLGSDAGFEDENDPQQIAIKKAVDAGVVVVVASGNAQYSTAPYKLPHIKDTGVVGAPGTAKDALTVANYHNNMIMLPSIKYNSDKETGKIPYMLSGDDKHIVYNKPEKIINANLGKVEDFQNLNASGKIVLVKRGDITFVDKAINAQNAGATGIIIYNNDHDDSFVNMNTDNRIKIPYVFIRNSDGVLLQNLIANETTIEFSEELVKLDSIDKGDFVESSSWGPTPSLDFKPQISAPGGNIFSTLNNNQYGMMTGTSMAAPHVAGGEALIVQHLKKSNPSLKGRKLVEFAKNSAINTSKIQMDIHHKGVPYSPRRQGAGLIQINDAIKNNVIVQDKNNNATVALKEIGNETEFVLTLTNYGNTDASYKVENIGGVLTETSDQLETMSYDVRLNGATISFDQENIVVPAQKSATVTVKLSIDQSVSRNRFVEGFIQFQGNNIPSLSVPFIGYYGDWGEEQIIEAMDFDSENQKFVIPSSLLTNLGGKIGYGVGLAKEDTEGNLQTDPTKIAISPNGDGNGDILIPQLYFLRNAKVIEVEILDQDKKSLGVVASVDHVRKQVFNTIYGKSAIPIIDLAWNGTILNPQNGKVEQLSEGQYFVNIKSKVDLDTAKFQEMILPIHIDLSAPEIKLTSSKKVSTNTDLEEVDYELTWSVEDNVGIIPKIATIYVNQTPVEATITYSGNEYKAIVKLKKDHSNEVQIMMIDTAFNEKILKETIHVDTAETYLEFYDNIIDQTITVTNSNEYTFKGKVVGKLKEFKINNENVVVESDGTFQHKVSLQEGLNDFLIYAKDVNDKELYNFYAKVLCNISSPIIKDETPISKDETPISKDNSAKIENDSTRVEKNSPIGLVNSNNNEQAENVDQSAQTKQANENNETKPDNKSDKVNKLDEKESNQSKQDQSSMTPIYATLVVLVILSVIIIVVQWKRKKS